MNHARAKTKLLSGIAAATLAVWLVAQFFCTLHCTSGKGSMASVAAVKNCCHKTVQHSDNDVPKPDGNSTPNNCFAFKLLAPTPNSTHDLFAADPLQPVPFVLAAELLSLLDLESSSSDRPAPRPDRVIAHEVS